MTKGIMKSKDTPEEYKVHGHNQHVNSPQRLFRPLPRLCLYSFLPPPVSATKIVTIVTEWLRAWDTLTMFEATVCGRS